MTDEQLRFWLKTLDPLMVEVRDLGDGRYACVSRLLFHYTLKVGRIGDDVGYDDRWCYQDLVLALAALRTWNPGEEPEPTGWHRHPNSGRRRPNGNPAKEYVSA